MATTNFRFALTTVNGIFKSTLHNGGLKVKLMAVMSIPVRRLFTLQVTKNLALVSSEKKDTKFVNLKLQKPEHKPLCVMHCWLMARPKHINKYVKIYLDKGFDVLCVTLTPWQLLWPRKGTQVVASDILKFLDRNTAYTPLVLHGLSVGGYLWAEVMVKMASEQARYQHIIDNIAGQVWDSAADVTELSIGLPLAVFPRNTVMQKALRQYIQYHLKTFDKVATRHYIRASQMFQTNLVKAPAQFFISKTDPVGAESSNLRVKEYWENTGIQVYWKCWDKSPHVGHLHHHPEEYKAQLIKFLDDIGFSSQSDIAKERMQAKL